MPRKKTWNKEQFIEAVKNNYSVAGVLRELKLKIAGANYKTVHTYINELELDVSHWTGQGHGLTVLQMIIGNTIPLEKILVENGTYTTTSSLKKRLLKDGVLINKCYVCGQLPEWKDLPLVMVLDHINGKNTDHRLENLRLLCPNCNSQQITFAGRNKKINRMPKIIYNCEKCGKILNCERKTGLCVICKGELRRKSEEEKAIKKICIGYCVECGEQTKGRSSLCIRCAHKKQRKVGRPDYNTLINEINETNYVAVGCKYGVSDNAIRKWVRAYEIERDNRKQGEEKDVDS